MKELVNNIEDKSKDDTQNISIFFDDNAWEEMETLLNKDERKSPLGVMPLTSLKYRFFTKGNAGPNP